MAAARAADGDAAIRAHELLALSYQAAASVLTKLGEADLAWIAAERGLTAAQRTDSKVILGSLFRSVAHTLLSTGRFQPAVQLVDRAAAVLSSELGSADGPMLSVYGSLFLAGAMAASRAEDRPTTQAFLREAQQAASRLGADANYMWTAFGRRTSRFTRSTRRRNSETCRSHSTSARRWIPPGCRPSGGSDTRWTLPAPTAPATGVMKRWRSSWTLSGWRPNRCAITTSAASWC